MTIANSGTGFSRQSVTDASGYYNFQTVPVGSYNLTISGAGFTTATATVNIDPSEKGRLDVQLTVQGTTTTVEVQGSAAQLSRDDASIGFVVENPVIESMPLLMRNWDDLRLVPGVQQNRYTEQGGATASGRTGDFQVNGVHSLQNDFILDGIDDNTFSENVQELSTEATRPSIDVIQEFKVLTNPYSAQYGRSPGAAVDVSTIAGTNEIHGLLFEYLRNRIFDSNDFFSNRSGLAKPEDIQNQFGGNVGAPIINNKLFGFFDYEGTRIAAALPASRLSRCRTSASAISAPAAAAANGVKYPTIDQSRHKHAFRQQQIPHSVHRAKIGTKVDGRVPSAEPSRRTEQLRAHRRAQPTMPIPSTPVSIGMSGTTPAFSSAMPGRGEAASCPGISEDSPMAPAPRHGATPPSIPMRAPSAGLTSSRPTW